MKAVYSLWTKPCADEPLCGYNDPWIFSRAARLSVGLAARQFDSVELVTDSRGARWMKRWKVPFDSVSTALDDLAHVDPRLWCYGKMRAYALQREPFVHLDFDVFLKRPLPWRVFRGKALVFQSWEPASMHRGAYARAVRACQVMGCRACPSWNGGELAVNAGMVAGLDLGEVRRWCAAAADWVENPVNRAFWERALRGDGFKFCIAMEQYLPLLLLGRGRIGVLFDEGRTPQELGYVHYAGGSKREPAIEKKILRFRLKEAGQPAGVPGGSSLFGDLEE